MSEEKILVIKNIDERIPILLLIYTHSQWDKTKLLLQYCLQWEKHDFNQKNIWAWFGSLAMYPGEIIFAGASASAINKI